MYNSLHTCFQENATGKLPTCSSPYIHCWTLYIQDSGFLYDSIVHAYYMGSSDVYVLRKLLCIARMVTWTENIQKHLWTIHVNVYTLYDSVYHVYVQRTYCVYTQTDMYMRLLLWVHTCPDHVYTMYRHGMYNFTFLWTCISRNKKNAMCQE